MSFRKMGFILGGIICGLLWPAWADAEIAGPQAADTSQQEVRFSFQVKTPSYTLQNAGEWTVLDCRDAQAEPLLVEGRPYLFALRCRIAVPDDAVIKSISIQGRERFIPLDRPLMPAPRPTPISQPPPIPIPDARIYGSPTVYPAENFNWRLVKQASTRMLELTLYPFKYRGATTTLVTYETLSAEVVVGTRDKPTARPLNEVERQIAPALLNGDSYLAGRIAARPATVSPHGLIGGLPADYIILTPQAWTSALNYYVSQKIAQGIATRVFSLEDINAAYGSPDAATNMFLFIRDAFTNWNISYVLLAGDTTNIPTRFQRPGARVPQEYDNYFVLLDGQYDYYQDAYIGRLPARSAAELTAISSRWADYDSHGWGRTEFSLTGEPLEIYRADDFSNLNWQVTSLWGKDVGVTITTNDVKAAMNQGSALIDWVGHGSDNIWQVAEDAGLGAPFYYTSTDALALTNGARIPFVNALCSCYTAVFSRTNCIANGFIQAPQAGALGYIGANEEVKFASMEIYANRWFMMEAQDQFRRTAAIRPGVAFHDVIAGRGNALRLFNLLGDPTARMDLRPVPADAVPPAITQTSVSAGPHYPGGWINFTATATDNDCVGIVTLSVTSPSGSNQVQEMSCGSISNFSTTVSAPFTSNAGHYAVTILARDVSSNSCPVTNLAFDIEEDLTPPVVTNIAVTPQPAASNTTLNIVIAAGDDSGGQLTIWAEITRPSGAVTTNQSWDLMMFMDTAQTGRYDITAWAQDYSGNVSAPYSSNFAIRADTQPPIIHDAWITTQTYWSAGSIYRMAFLRTSQCLLYLYILGSDDLTAPFDLRGWAEIRQPDGQVFTNDLLTENAEWPARLAGSFQATNLYGEYRFDFGIRDKSGNTADWRPLYFNLITNNLPFATVQAYSRQAHVMRFDCVALPDTPPEVWWATNLQGHVTWNPASPLLYSVHYSNGVHKLSLISLWASPQAFFKLNLTTNSP